jgi:hypothetical protein
MGSLFDNNMQMITISEIPFPLNEASFRKRELLKLPQLIILFEWSHYIWLNIMSFPFPFSRTKTRHLFCPSQNPGRKICSRTFVLHFERDKTENLIIEKYPSFFLFFSLLSLCYLVSNFPFILKFLKFSSSQNSKWEWELFTVPKVAGETWLNENFGNHQEMERKIRMQESYTNPSETKPIE